MAYDVTFDESAPIKFSKHLGNEKKGGTLKKMKSLFFKKKVKKFFRGSKFFFRATWPLADFKYEKMKSFFLVGFFTLLRNSKFSTILIGPRILLMKIDDINFFFD